MCVSNTCLRAQQPLAACGLATTVAAAAALRTAGYGLGMMNLEVLKVGNNKIPGPLPVSYASLRQPNFQTCCCCSFGCLFAMQAMVLA
jgi:hypothetical protein